LCDAHHVFEGNLRNVVDCGFVSVGERFDAFEIVQGPKFQIVVGASRHEKLVVFVVAFYQNHACYSAFVAFECVFEHEIVVGKNVEFDCFVETRGN
jgi:hypothetical protein